MKRLLVLMSASVLLAACSKKEPPPEPVRPVLSIEVQAESQENLGRFAGSIQARFESNIGFRVPGRIARRNVDVGSEVQKGALLATLDPTDQQNQLRASQGDLARIEAQWINAQARTRIDVAAEEGAMNSFTNLGLEEKLERPPHVPRIQPGNLHAI